MNEEKMQEMESVITPDYNGNILVKCRNGDVGLVLRKGMKDNRPIWYGRKVKYTDLDTEYRITGVRDMELLDKNWQSVDPDPIGFIPLEDVKELLEGKVITKRWLA